ncbi:MULTISPECIES: nucleotide exchange factor GrpE [Gordonia]|uniref:nucleotide exchange factor GrpE n=2 Tax=Gordoniaceae TaxID=85026 RepID=UPI00201E487C|nr:nucleotide exchange factor GrpE [Gordonia sp. GAMMA]
MSSADSTGWAADPVRDPAPAGPARTDVGEFTECDPVYPDVDGTDRAASREGAPTGEVSGRPAAAWPSVSSTVDFSELHLRFDRMESAMATASGVVERNYEQSLIALRDRAAAAEVGMTQTLLRPIARQLAALIDRVELEQGRRQVDPWALSASVVDELHDILEDFGIETIECPPGSEVDKARHRVVTSRSPRGSSDDTLRIVERVRHGYELSGYVIRPAEVAAEWTPEWGDPTYPG